MGLGQKITLHLNSQRKLTRELLMGASWQFVRPRGWELGWPRLPRSPPSLPSITVEQSTAGQLTGQPLTFDKKIIENPEFKTVHDI